MASKSILLKNKAGEQLLPVSKAGLIELVNDSKSKFGSSAHSVQDALTYLVGAYNNMNVSNNISDAAYGVQVTVDQVDGVVQKPVLSITKGAVESGNNNFVTGGDVHSAIADLTGAMHFVGAVASTDAVENPKAGDVCIITSTSKEYVYTDNGWVELGDENLYSAKADTVHKIVTSGTAKDYATVVLDAAATTEDGMLTYTMSYSVEVAVQGIADATAAKQGLADAYDVKSYMGTYMDASIKALDTTADVVTASVADGVVTLTAGIAEADGIITKGSGADITLAKIATTGAATDASVTLAADSALKTLMGVSDASTDVAAALEAIAAKANASTADAVTEVEVNNGGYVKIGGEINDNTLTISIDDDLLGSVASLNYSILNRECEDITSEFLGTESLVAKDASETKVTVKNDSEEMTTTVIP